MYWQAANKVSLDRQTARSGDTGRVVNVVDAPRAQSGKLKALRLTFLATLTGSNHANLAKWNRRSARSLCPTTGRAARTQGSSTMNSETVGKRHPSTVPNILAGGQLSLDRQDGSIGGTPDAFVNVVDAPQMVGSEW